MITFEDRDELAGILDQLAAMEAPSGERPNRCAIIRRAIRREVDRNRDKLRKFRETQRQNRATAGAEHRR
jgi:hypothetical protein